MILVINQQAPYQLSIIITSCAAVSAQESNYIMTRYFIYSHVAVVEIRHVVRYILLIDKA